MVNWMSQTQIICLLVLARMAVIKIILLKTSSTLPRGEISGVFVQVTFMLVRTNEQLLSKYINGRH